VTPRLRGIAVLAAVLLQGRAAAQPDGDLPAALKVVIDGSPLTAARTAIYVASVDTGETVYARDPDALLNPASNVKLVTTAAALVRLGPEFRFSTEFLGDQDPAQGEVRTLYVRGRGDPSIVTERLWGMAGELAHLGLRRVRELVLDDGYFDGERFGPGFDQEDGDRPYLAPAGALSLDFNSIEVVVTPAGTVGQKARIDLEPASAFFTVENRTVTSARTGRARVVVSTQLERGKERVVVEGRVPVGSRPHAVWRRIDDPALFFGNTLQALLEQRGVKTDRIRTGRTPESAHLLHVSQSDALAEVVRRLNKTSNNFTAEQLLKTLGAEVKGQPGTWAKGVDAAEDVLAEMGLPRGSYVMRNGSGLNDTNRFSARQLVMVLRAMWLRFPLQPEYAVSLPVAGRDGTIRWRMDGTPAAGRLRAKTGTLEGVVALSGYVQNAAGKVLAFAILVNDSPGRPGVVRAVDAVGATLAASGGPPASAVPASISASPAGPIAASAPADLAERIRTYYALGRTADARNEAFLRSALRAERDTAVRLAVAECLVLSNPDEDSAGRPFLDALAADPQAVPRLWQLLPDAEPVVGSLADLAAEPEPDALRRLVELAGRPIDDERLATAVRDAMASVSASAPEELVSALHAAPPEVADMASARLLAGLSRSEEKDHPFPAALRALAARGDALSEYAGKLSAQVDATLPPRPVPAARSTTPARTQQP
jgi:D-alanyl-D-alanine carboxypeptidase/D-alanyl-D-alanine-endopeptidase (penicillin-binding protein 4)